MTYAIGERVRVTFEAVGKVTSRTFEGNARIGIETDDGMFVEVPAEHVTRTGEVVMLPVKGGAA